MSDFRHRFGLQLAAASADLLAAHEGDFRARLGVQLTRAAGELAAGRAAPHRAFPARRESAPPVPRPGRAKLKRPFAPGLSLLDFRGRFGVQLTRAAGELAAGRGSLGRPRGADLISLRHPRSPRWRGFPRSAARPRAT